MQTNEIVKKFLDGNLNRRDFIKKFTILTGSLTLGSSLSCFYKISGIPNVITAHEDFVLDSVQEHLFPKTEDAPGARDINALYYLHFVLLDPNMDSRENEVITDGVKSLEKLCLNNYNKSFIDLTHIEKERLLKKVSNKNWGEYFLSYLLKYIFEALLADPNYGGNPDGVGWKWLGHFPGYPRPKKENIYPKLLEI